MKQKHITLFFVGLNFLALNHACLANENHLLTGVWSSKCASDGTGNFNIETFKFSGNSANYSINTYRDSACKKPISSLKTYRDFKLGAKVNGLPHTRKLDYVFNNVTMTYTDSSVIKEANISPGYYGFTQWKLNQPHDVSGQKRTPSSSPEHSKGEKFYTIVKIDNDKLYMGDYSSGSGASDKTRLSAIYNVPFIKHN